MKFKITAYCEDEIITRVVEADSKKEAERIGWETLDADDIYVSEVK